MGRTEFAVRDISLYLKGFFFSGIFSGRFDIVPLFCILKNVPRAVGFYMAFHSIAYKAAPRLNSFFCGR